MSNSNPVFLYVEDDMASRQVVKVLITRVMRHEHLHIFENSDQLMSRIRVLNPKPTIIFLDIQMKPYNGYEVLTMLRNEADFADSIIIAMTANVMSHDVEQLKQSGFNGLIGKPIDSSIFPQLVSRMINGETVWYLP